MEFTETPWIKDYIEKNAISRANTKVEHEKDLYKLMNNSVFGKTMENLSKRVNGGLIADEKLKIA